MKRKGAPYLLGIFMISDAFIRFQPLLRTHTLIFCQQPVTVLACRLKICIGFFPQIQQLLPIAEQPDDIADTFFGRSAKESAKEGAG